MQKLPLITNWLMAWELIEKEFDLKLSLDQQNKTQLFYKILFETNQFMNLTRLSSEEDFLTFHLLDTIMLLSAISKLKLPENIKYLDLGSGGGIPGIILHILSQSINLKSETYLCDSRQKKANYLRKVAEELTLNSINISHERAEILKTKQNYKRQFDLITARAFAKPLECLNAVKPFLKPNGYFLAQSTTNLNEDSAYEEALSNFKLNLEEIIEFDLADKKRFILIIKKN
jgi:16S rRNA (guanine527-N7)-methyltransferase